MENELKQKQIEEMAKDMLDYGMEKYPTGESVFTETKLREQFYHVFLTYAEYLINAGYRKIEEGSVVLTREEYEKLLDANFGCMTSPIGDLEINPKGMLKAVDEIARLGRVETELQNLNARYYNEAKDLRRNMAKLRRETYSKEEVDYKLAQERKETAEKFAEEVEMWKRKAIHYYNLAKESGMYCVVDDEVCKELVEGKK